MHLGKFHEVMIKVADEIVNGQLLQKFDGVIAHLQVYVNSQVPENAVQFRNTLDVLRASTTEAASNFFRPSERDILEHTGADLLLGEKLFERVASIIKVDNVTPAQALASLTELRLELGKFVDSLNGILAGFATFRVERDRLEAGHFELGIILPRATVGERVEDLAEELKELNQLMKTCSELVGEGSSSPRIRTISSTDWQIVIDQSVLLAPMIAYAVDKILDMLKKNLEIKLLQKQLAEKEMPKEITEMIEDHIEKAITKDIRKISEDVVALNAKIDDNARKNELTNALTICLRRLAKRLNQGADVEFRAELPSLPEQPSAPDEPSQSEYKHQVMLYEERKRVVMLVNKTELHLLEKDDALFDSPLLITEEPSAARPPEEKPSDGGNEK